MKIISKKIGIILLAFLFVVFPILNCCLLESAHANSTIEDSHHEVLGQTQKEDCHSHGSNDSDTPNADECNWGDTIATLPNQACSYLSSITVKAFSFHTELAAFHKSNNLSLDANSLSYLHSPPQNSRDSIPIYLQNSTLRI